MIHLDAPTRHGARARPPPPGLGAKESRLALRVVPADGEAMIAEHTHTLAGGGGVSYARSAISRPALSRRNLPMARLRPSRRALLRAAALGLLRVGRAPAAEPPAIAAAADLTYALPEIAALFARASGHEVKLVFGSSGNFAAEIANGAPFEVFLSADESYVAALARDGRTLDAGVLYAEGRIGVFVTPGAAFTADPALDGLRAALAQGRVRKFAIANPDHAPYGRAAREALAHAGLWEALAPHLVLGENVAQAAQFIRAGAAEGGILPLSLARAPVFAKAGQFALIAADWHQPLRQRMARPSNRDAPLLDLAPEMLLSEITADYMHAQLCHAALHAFAAENEARMEAWLRRATRSSARSRPCRRRSVRCAKRKSRPKSSNSRQEKPQAAPLSDDDSGFEVLPAIDGNDRSGNPASGVADEKRREIPDIRDADQVMLRGTRCGHLQDLVKLLREFRVRVVQKERALAITIWQIYAAEELLTFL